MGFQSRKSPNLKNFGTLTLEFRDKMTFECWARHRKYYKGEGGGLLQVWVVVSLVRSCLPMVRLYTKSVPIMH